MSVFLLSPGVRSTVARLLAFELCWAPAVLAEEATPTAEDTDFEALEEEENEDEKKKKSALPAALRGLEFYGFARLDAVYASGGMGHRQLGLWAAAPDSPHADESTFALYARWSRLGLDWQMPVAWAENDAHLAAKIEMDFLGGGSERDMLPRLRLAYGEVKVNDWALRAGQDWDLLAPLHTGGLEHAVFWNGGNLGDRRPQLSLRYSPKWGPAQWVVAGAVAQSGAVDNADVDGDGRVDGLAAGAPAGQALLELKLDWGPEHWKPIRVGLSGHLGSKRLEVAGGQENIPVQAVNAHLQLPIGPVTLGAEAWIGRNLSDVRGGIGQGVILLPATVAGEPERAMAIAARGGWAHLHLDWVRWLHLEAGAGIDAPVDVPTAARSLNQTFYAKGSLLFWDHLQFNAGYDLYRTSYQDQPAALVHRATGYTAVIF